MKQLKIHPLDNVAVDIETGHKKALVDIPEGANVVKYGFPIGHATKAIKKGEIGRLFSYFYHKFLLIRAPMRVRCKLLRQVLD